ncbi:MAG: SPOR domain-containing protein [Hyphomicrobiaceae bacterium]
MGLRTGATAIAAFLVLCDGFGLSTITAQAAGKLSVQQARETILSGIKAFEGGDNKKAVSSLSYALSSGGLTSTDMAKALYYRGRAYRKQGRHAQAISDLTSAIWLKNGLSESEKAKARAERAAAYKTAGVASPVPVVSEAASVAAAPSSKSPKPSVQTAAKKPAPVIPSSTAAVRKSVPSGVVAKTAPVQIAQANQATSPAKKPAPRPYTPPQPSSGDFTVGVPLEYQSTRKDLSSAPPGQARAAGSSSEASQKVQSGSNESANPLEAVGSFFSDLFSGGLSGGSTPAPTSNFSGTTSQLGPSPSPQTAVSGWNSTSTKITTGSTKNKQPKPTQIAALAPKPVKRSSAPVQKRVPVAAKPSQSGGKYGLQVAVLKTRGEAEAVVAKLMQKHSAILGSRVPSIDEQVFGNMGKYYRVKVGNYANTGEPKTVCSKIAKDGYDCFVVQK